MRLVINEELLLVAGGDAAATRSGNVNSWGEEYESGEIHEETPTISGCNGSEDCIEAIYNSAYN